MALYADACKAIIFIKRFFVKQHVLFLLMGVPFCSHAMDNQLLQQSKKTPVIMLNKNQIAFIRWYLVNSRINVEAKKHLINGLKPKKKRRV